MRGVAGRDVGKGASKIGRGGEGKGGEGGEVQTQTEEHD